MRKFAVIGNPIKHSLSPAIHNYVFRELGIYAKYSPIHCNFDNLSRIIDNLQTGKLNGINVTIPFKQSVIPYVDLLDEHSEKIGAVNCVSVRNRELIGHNTDWIGFQQLLAHSNISVAGKVCIVIGAGGTARSIIYSLAQDKTDKILIINRTKKHAEELQKQMMMWFPQISLLIGELEQLSSTDLNDAVIINCTSIGMEKSKDVCPIPEKLINSSQAIIDVIYSPTQTKLCKIGKDIGAFTTSGLTMLIYQALASLNIWFDEPITENIHYQDLHNYLIKNHLSN